MSDSVTPDSPWLSESGESENFTTYPKAYLPMDCPQCDRRRLLAQVRTDEGRGFVIAGSIECEKCGWKPRV